MLGAILIAIVGILLIYRLFKVTKMIMQPDFWKGLSIHACFVSVVVIFFHSGLFHLFYSTFLVALAFVWFVATTVFAEFEINIKKNLPKSQCLLLAVSRIGVFLIAAFLSVLITCVTLGVGEYILDAQITEEIFALSALMVFGWFNIVIRNRQARFPVFVLLQMISLGFLIHRLDILSAGGSDIGYQEALSNDTVDANDTANGGINPLPGHVNDPVTTYEQAIHNDAYAKIDPDINPFPHQIHQDPGQLSYAEQTASTTATFGGSGDINFSLSEITRQGIQDSFGFSAATITESSTHITITDANGVNLFLHPDTTGGYAIQGPDSHHIGHITADGTIQDAQSFTAGHIKQVGNNVALTDHMGMSVGHIDSTTGAVIDKQGMTVGKVWKNNK